MPRLARWLLILVALLLVAAVALVVLLQGSEGVRQRLLARASRALEDGAGLSLEAESSRLRVASGAVELGGVVIRNPAGETLLAVDELRARVGVRQLLGGRVEVRSLELVGPRLDLRVPLPERGEPSEPDAGTAVEIQRLAISAGEVVGLPLPEGSRDWATGMSVDRIDLAGSLSGGGLDLGLEGARLRVDRAAAPALELFAEGALSGPLSGPLDLTRLRLSGESLELTAAGRLGLADEQPFELEFDGSLDSGRLLELLRPAAAESSEKSGGGEGGSISAGGRLDLRAGSGSVRLDIAPLPAELLGAWLEPETLESLGLPGTTLELDGALDLGPGALDRLAGDLRLTWARGGETLLVVEAQPRPPAAGEALLAPVELLLAPALAGRRWAGATVRMESWERPAEALLEDGRLELEVPDLRRGWESLSALFPALRGSLPEPPAGSLAAGGSFSGPISAPAADLEAVWRPREGAALRVSAVGEPLALRGELEARLERLPLAALSDELSGLLDGELAVTGSAEAWSASFDLRGEELGAGEVRDASMVAAGSATPDAVRFTALEASWPGHRFQGVDPEAEGGGPLTVEVTDRGLFVNAPWLAVDGVEGSLQAEVPAALVDELPGLKGRRWPGADAAERRPRIVWNLHPSDLAPLLGLEGRRLVVASEGDLRVNLQRPALSAGSARVTPLELLVDEKSMAVEGEVELTLAEGRLEVAVSRLAAGGDSLGLDGDLLLSPEWSVGDDPAGLVTALDVDAAASLDAVSVGELAGLTGVAGDRLDVRLELSGAPSDLSGRLVAEAPGVSWSSGELTASEPALDLLLERGAWRLERLEVELDGEPLAARGAGSLASDRLEVEELRLDFAGVELLAKASVPLAAGEEEAAGELLLEWTSPLADWHTALAHFGLMPEEDSLRLATAGELRLPLARPWAAEGWAEISDLETLTGGRRARAEGPLRLRLGGGELELEPFALLAEEQRFSLSGSAELDEGWTPEQGALELVRHLRASGNGTLLTSLFNPILAGGIAEGFLEVELELAGAPSALEGRLGLRGDEVSLTYPRPYWTRLSRPRLELTLEAGEVARLSGSLELNEGTVELSGGMTGEGVADLEARLEGVRYRFDYGMLALLSGELALIRSSTGDLALTGGLVVEEGVLTRDINVDLDLVAELLAPVDLTGTEESPLEAVALDLEVSTVEGVRIKNNVADLLVIWDPILVGGNLAAPVLDGRLSIEPGGRIRAFGQTVRLDRSSIDFPGQPDQPATLDFTTTSSKEDSSIASLSSEDPFGLRSDEQGELSAQLTAAAAGLGSYYGEQFASRISEGASVSLQPILIFGEADPGARLTVSQDFSPQFTLAASIDLRNAEAQTYVLDLHGLQGLPGLNAQAFTTDQATRGAALRQRLTLGGQRRQRSSDPRIVKIHYPRIEGVSKRGIRRALGLAKGDRLGGSDRFAAEVELGEYLRGRGFSDARVSVTVSEHGKGVALTVEVQPGPRADFVFTGEDLSRPLRRLVKSLYRSDFYEETALTEMAAEARRGLRSLGFLEPRVEVTVAPHDPALDPSDSGGDRTVTVSMEGGRRIELERLIFEPLPEDEEELLLVRFRRPVQRVELAAGVPDADRRVEATLRFLGYREPRVARRELSDDGSELRVELEVDERPRIAGIQITGVEEERSRELLELTGLEPGAPLRPDRIGRAAVVVREELRRQGFTDAEIETRVEPRVALAATAHAAGEPGFAEVSFDLDRGDRYWIGEVTFEGMRSTRRGWAREVAGLELESDFYMDDVLEARSRLWRTGLFNAVVPRTYRAPGGAVRVGFELRERSRFEVAYGLRWDSEEELSALVELVDRNALGRGWLGGLRVQAASDDQSVRAFGGLPRLFNARSSLELFALLREETEDGVITETAEATIQLSYALKPRLTARLYGQYKDSHIFEEVPSDFFPIDVRLRRPLLGTQLLYDRRRGEQLDVRGLLVTGDLSLSDEFLGSDFRYARFFGQANSYLGAGGLMGRPLVWAQSVRVGLAEAFDQELVRQDRFFAGGAFSVRGYATESLGPEEDLVVVVRPLGGEALLVVNEELRWRFQQNLTGLWFVDAGNVWDVRSDFGSDLALSTGLGLRALTPVGLLRLDLAHALDGRPGIDPEWKVYFGFGSTF